jgi:hypothetical protein
METRWTWLRAADTQAVRESRSSTERSVFHARHRVAVSARFGGVGEVERARDRDRVLEQVQDRAVRVHGRGQFGVALLMPNAMKPDFQCARTRWIRGFIAFPKGRPAPGVMLMVSV